MYMSPELWELVNGDKKKAAAAKVDEQKADVWSYGLMLLSAGLGLTIDVHNSIYLKRTKTTPAKVDMTKLNDWISRFKATYEKDANSILGLVVELCLKEAPAERPSSNDILSHHLPSYKEVCDHFERAQDVMGYPTHVQEVVEVHAPRPAQPAPVTQTHVVQHHNHYVDHGDHAHVVHHEHHHEGPVIHSTVERREPRVIHEGQQPEVVKVIRRDPEVRREYIPLEGHTHVEHTHEVPPVRVSHGAVRRIEGEVRRVEGEVRRVEGEVRRVSHAHPEVRQSHTVRQGEVRRVEGEVRRVQGEVRRVEGEVRRVSHAHPQATIVQSHAHVAPTHVHEVAHTHGGHAHTHQVAHTHGHQQQGNVRVIRDPVEVAAYKEKMALKQTKVELVDEIVQEVAPVVVLE